MNLDFDPIASFDPQDSVVQQLPKPFPKQAELIDVIRQLPEGKRAIIGYGGAMGGGKSSTLILAAINYGLSYPGARILIGRWHYNDLETSTFEVFQEMIPAGFYTHDIGRKVTSFRLPHWPEGVRSRIFWRGLNDYRSFQSTAFGFVGIDEGDGVTEKNILWLLGRLRQVIGGRSPKYVLLACSNPSPSWFEHWFLRGKIDAEAFAKAGVGKVVFVPSKTSDNPYLPEDYEAGLRAIYPAAMAQALLDGSFDALEDQWFDNITEHHILTQAQIEASNFPTFSIPWKEAPGGRLVLPQFEYAIGGLDFAGPSRDAHFSGGLVCLVLPGGNRDVACFEFKDRGPGIMGRQETWMRRVELALERRISWFADKTQPTGIEFLQSHGFKIETNEGKEDSWEVNLHMGHDRLQRGEDGVPKSLFLDTCPETVRQLKRYRVINKAMPDGNVKLVSVGIDDDLVDPWLYAHEWYYRRRIDPNRRWDRHKVVPYAFANGEKRGKGVTSWDGVSKDLPRWAKKAREIA